jgi:undecaprenyl-diphosphatase
MGLLYLLEDIRIPVFNEFMLAITTLGEETAFLVIALVLFWCVNKYLGYYVLSVGFVGTIFNQFLKLLFRIPRPWVLDQNFTILEEAREAATGYSFPSGHTQSAVGTFGSIGYTAKNRKIRIAAIVIAALVAFSRMYIGVHTPLDVLVSIGLAVVLIVVLRPVVLGNSQKYMPYLLGVMLLLAAGFLAFVKLFPFPGDIDPHNYESGLKNAFTLLGALLGLLTVYIVDEKWLNFNTKAIWWAQILKVAIGLGLVLIVKSGTKEVLNMLLGESVGRSVRYFLIVVVAGILWPLSFKWFSKLGKKE